MNILNRIGSFVLIVALGLLVLFFLSQSVGEAEFGYLFAGFILILLGYFLKKRNPQVRTPSGRFRINLQIHLKNIKTIARIHL